MVWNIPIMCKSLWFCSRTVFSWFLFVRVVGVIIKSRHKKTISYSSVLIFILTVFELRLFGILEYKNVSCFCQGPFICCFKSECYCSWLQAHHSLSKIATIIWIPSLVKNWVKLTWKLYFSRCLMYILKKGRGSNLKMYTTYFYLFSYKEIRKGLSRKWTFLRGR